MTELEKQSITLNVLALVACIVAMVLIFTNTVTTASAVAILVALIAAEVGITLVRRERNEVAA